MQCRRARRTAVVPARDCEDDAAHKRGPRGRRGEEKGAAGPHGVRVFLHSGWCGQEAAQSCPGRRREPTGAAAPTAAGRAVRVVWLGRSGAERAGPGSPARIGRRAGHVLLVPTHPGRDSRAHAAA